MKQGRKLSRREFVQTGIAAAAVPLFAAPTILPSKGGKPLVIASRNGNVYKNGGQRTAVHEAFQRIVRGDDVLDAILAGVTILELDPTEDSVGYGGLPNGEGVVQLDACVMHGPKRRAGGVGALEGVRTPSLVAKAVMENTDHHLLVGAGAQAFARQMGFTIENDLNTERSRTKWLEWKRRMDPAHFLDPEKRSDAGDRAREAMLAAGTL
ncbi:MAG TPA: isoaspartyl peptidase/L-asparaginase, partial [Candidatus Polarisedimenticolaceae bacterium]|nr:isoaspartyl peptidase/L-asparaginase [Candidatus Polarisedimenticolaceae bacterium]